MNSENVYEAFRFEFKAARDEVYRRSKAQFPLGDVLDMMVEASYANLVDAVTGKLILEGRILAAPGKHPKEKIQDLEIVTKEILSIVGTALGLLDTKHEYAVGMVKHERRTQSL